MTTLSPALPAAAPAKHMSPLRAVKHARTLAWRALVRIRRNPEQLLDVTLQPIIFTTLFVFLFGGAMSGTDRHGYVQFVLPGIMVQTLVFASVGTGVGLNTDITKGIFDRFRSMPIARSAPLSGAIAGDMFRYVASFAVLFAYGSLLGFRVETNVWFALAGFGLLIVFASALCWVWALLGLIVRSPQSVQGFGFIVMFPLTFGSNVFVQTNTLLGWLQAWVKVNPVTALTDAMRGLYLGGPIASPVWRTLAWAAGIAIVFAPLAVRRYRRIA
ncbi:MAG TPA: ABC transporter permease [Micromonosporaceae bacterium]|nr:ABC transporter permease [Micromonosporaceae bacterium]